MPDIELVSERLGSLYTVPEEDWAAIHQRVDYAENLRDIAGDVARYLPAFPTLVDACEEWRTTTFAGIVISAARLSGYSAQAQDAFSKLEASADWNGPLSSDVQQRVVHTIDELAASTAALAQEFNPLAVAVSSFAQVNRQADAEIDAYRRRMGPEWRTILPSTQRVDDATGLVNGAWQALTADLEALAAGLSPDDVTGPFVLGLEIAVAERAWGNLKDEANAFKQQAPAQAYLSEVWPG
ncbi:MAG: hypothetical protein ACJ72W_08150 [Actinoallomurus sp.]